MKEIMRFESNYYEFILKLESDDSGASRLLMVGGNGVWEQEYPTFEAARTAFMEKIEQHSRPGYLRATAI